jgi:hypothetical protein
MAPGFAGTRVDRKLGCREDVLPGPRAIGIGVFAAQGEREKDASIALGKVAMMEVADAFEMDLKWPAESLRENGHSFAQAFGVAHGDMAVAEINVFDAQPKAFHEAEAAAVE